MSAKLGKIYFKMGFFVAKFFISIFFVLMFFCRFSYAEPVSLNQEVLLLKEKVGLVRSNINEIDLQLSDLDRKTTEAEAKKQHPKNMGDFLVINKTFFYLLLGLCVGIGILLRILFVNFKNRRS